MSKTYVVLGAGRQGVAAAYDLARFGDASTVRLLDREASLAERAVERLRALVPADGGVTFEAGAIDARDADAARAVIEGADAVLSAVPYFLNPPLARAAIAVGASFCDLGGNDAVSAEVLGLDAEARAAGVTVTPDCGLAPGMASSLAACLIDRVPRPRHVRMRCGGLPQDPKPPLDYMIVFAVEGLTNEYFGEATVLREGQVVKVPTLEEDETIEVEGLGQLEAFTTSGGASTCPETYKDELTTFDYKTLRYPGHVEKMRVLRDLGFFAQEPVEMPALAGGTVTAAPRDVLHDRLRRHLAPAEGARDLVVLRVECEGDDTDGRPVRQRLEIVDRHDEATGFSAMERCTAFAAAIICAHLATGRAPKGGVPVERVMGGEAFLDALKGRGIPVRETVERQIASANR